MPKRGKKGAVAEDGDELKTEPEPKKSKTAAKKNDKEAAGEGPALYEDPRSENLTQWQTCHTQDLLLERGWASSLD